MLAKHDGQLTFEAVSEMTYIEMTCKESLRMFPPTGILLRLALRPYRLPGTDLTIDKGVMVAVSLQGMQNDEKHFEKPDEFRPDRFQPDFYGDMLKRKIYLPFGDGHRACFGELVTYNQQKKIFELFPV